MYAIVRTGGKQYRAEAKGTLIVDTIDGDPGSKVELSEVLLVGGNGPVQVGSPTVPGAKVIATVIRQGKAKKIIGFKYKAKKNERKRFGHRQPRTYLRVEEVVSS